MGKLETQFLQDTVSALVDQITVFDQTPRQEDSQKNPQLSVLVLNISSVLNGAHVSNDANSRKGYTDYETKLVKLLKAVEHQVSAFEHFSGENLHIRVLCKNIRLIFHERRHRLRKIRNDVKNPEYQNSQQGVEFENQHNMNAVTSTKAKSNNKNEECVPILADSPSAHRNKTKPFQNTEDLPKALIADQDEGVEITALPQNENHFPKAAAVIAKTQLNPDQGKPITVISKDEHLYPSLRYKSKGLPHKLKLHFPPLSRKTRHPEPNPTLAHSPIITPSTTAPQNPIPQIRIPQKLNHHFPILAGRKPRAPTPMPLPVHGPIMTAATTTTDHQVPNASAKASANADTDTELITLLRQVLRDEGYDEIFIKIVINDPKKIDEIRQVLKEEFNYILKIDSSARMLRELVPSISVTKSISTPDFKKVVQAVNNQMSTRGRRNPYNTQNPPALSKNIASAISSSKCITGAAPQTSQAAAILVIPNVAETEAESERPISPILASAPASFPAEPTTGAPPTDHPIHRRFPFESETPATGDPQGNDTLHGMKAIKRFCRLGMQRVSDKKESRDEAPATSTPILSPPPKVNFDQEASVYKNAGNNNFDAPKYPEAAAGCSRTEFVRNNRDRYWNSNNNNVHTQPNYRHNQHPYPQQQQQHQQHFHHHHHHHPDRPSGSAYERDREHDRQHQHHNHWSGNPNGHASKISGHNPSGPGGGHDHGAHPNHCYGKATGTVSGNYGGMRSHSSNYNTRDAHNACFVKSNTNNNSGNSSGEFYVQTGCGATGNKHIRWE